MQGICRLRTSYQFKSVVSSGPIVLKERANKPLRALQRFLTSWANVSNEPFLGQCWLGRSEQFELCCGGGIDIGSDGNPCFTYIYNQRECCTSPFKAAVAPLAVGDAVGLDSLLRSSVHSKHPAFSKEQRRFEKLHIAASVALEVAILGIRLKIMTWKVQQKDVLDVVEELQSDMYKLKMRRFERARPQFVDIGANYGLVSMLLAKLYPASSVLSFEPVPEAFRYFMWNLKLNNVTSQVWPVNAGVGGAKCSHVTHVSMSVYWLRMFIRSPCFSFADIISTLTRGLGSEAATVAIDLLKIDCEGCEWSVLSGERSALLATQHVRRYVGEVHDFCLDCHHLKGSGSLHRTMALLCVEDHRPNEAMVGCEHLLRAKGVTLAPPAGRMLHRRVVERYK